MVNLEALMAWLEFREKPPQEPLKFKSLITHEFKSFITQLDFVKSLSCTPQSRFTALKLHQSAGPKLQASSRLSVVYHQRKISGTKALVQCRRPKPGC